MGSRRAVAGAFAVTVALALLAAGQVGSSSPARGGLRSASAQRTALDPLADPPAQSPDEIAASVPPPVVEIPVPIGGQGAIEALGPHLGAVAEAHGVTPGELERVLATDPTARIGTPLRLYYVEPALDGNEPTSAGAPIALPPLAAGADPLALHSRPGSTKTIYLDFDGATVTGTGWNNQPSLGTGSSFTNAPFDADGVPGTWSTLELAMVNDIWARVAEDYAPFDVDVTTADPGAAAIDRSSAADQVYGTTVVITSQSILGSVCGCGGIAFVDAFDVSSSPTTPAHGFLQPAMVFQQSLLGPFTSSKILAEAASHEAGHTLGLAHDGTASSAYYRGHGAWAPIMGAAYDKPVSQWSKGEYAGANNTEDDLAIIAAHGPNLIADDHGGLRLTATPTGGIANGVISSRTDIDWFSFETAGAASATISVTPASSGANADLVLTLTDSTGVVLASADPLSSAISADVADGVGASITRPLPGGRYYVSVTGTGALTPSTGYSSYASLGRYTLTTPTPSAPVCTPLPDGAVGWWRGEDTTAAEVGSPPVGSSSYRTGKVGRGFAPTAASSLVVPGEPAVSAELTVEAWVRPEQDTGRVLSLLSRWGASGRSADDVFLLLVLQDGSDGLVGWQVDEPSTMWPDGAAGRAPALFDGAFHHVAATFGAGRLVVYVDGEPIASNDVPVAQLTTTSSLPFRLFGPVGFPGVVDEPTVYDRALGAAEVRAITLAGSAGKCP